MDARTFVVSCTCGLREENLTDVSAQVRGDFHLTQQTRRSYRHAITIVREPSSKWSLRNDQPRKGVNKILGRWAR